MRSVFNEWFRAMRLVAVFECFTILGGREVTHLLVPRSLKLHEEQRALEGWRKANFWPLWEAFKLNGFRGKQPKDFMFIDWLKERGCKEVENGKSIHGKFETF